VQVSRRRRTGGNATEIGPDLIRNGDFASDTIWSKGTGWTIAAGVATAVATGASALSQTASFQSGKTYRVSFSITAQNIAGGGIAFIVGGGLQSTPRTGVGRYTQDVIAGATTTFQFNAAGAGTWEGSIDNVTVQKVGF